MADKQPAKKAAAKKGTSAPASTPSPGSPPQLIHNATAQRMGDILNQSKIGASKAGMTIIDMVAAVVGRANLEAIGLAPDEPGRRLILATFGKCLRAVADQLDPPGGAPVDPLAVHVEHPNSTNVKSSSYDPDKLILEVLFKNGGRYRYFDVPRTTRDAMMAAESVGSFVGKQIVSVFTFEKVG